MSESSTLGSSSLAQRGGWVSGVELINPSDGVYKGFCVIGLVVDVRVALDIFMYE